MSARAELEARARAGFRAVMLSNHTAEKFASESSARELRFLCSVFDEECSWREKSKRERLLKRARFPVPKTFDGLCFVKQIFRKSSSNSFGSQHERSSDFTKGCGTYPSFLFPSMSESVTRRLSPLNSTSLPWWTILSTSADASLSSANTVPHFPNSMLVVSTIDWRS